MHLVNIFYQNENTPNFESNRFSIDLFSANTCKCLGYAQAMRQRRLGWDST